MTDDTREDRIRHRAGKHGYVIRKDRARTYSADHQGGYQLVHADRNVIEAGERYDLSLDALEAMLADDPAI